MNSKLTKKHLIEEIKEELIVYFKRGLINPKSFFDIDDIRFSNLEDILKIHFILSDKVMDYIMNLEKNMRNIKSSTKLETELFTGQVKGSIDYNKTMQYRYNNNYKDKTKFVGIVASKQFNTKENKVLKTTIELIYNIINLDIGMERFEKFEWFKNGECITNIIKNIYRGNVYISKIDVSDVTDKMIEDVSKNRQVIYRNSALLLKFYKALMKRDRCEISKLFSSTFIEIEDEDRVFELYSIFKYLKHNFPREKTKYNVLDGTEEYLAVVEEGDYKYLVYHDSTGPDEISFNIDKSEIEKSENEFLKKKIKVLDEKTLIYTQLENKKSSSSIWRGRPDLLIVKLLEKKIIEITIGEAKYTTSKNYMYKGLEELLEYMNYIKYRDSELSEEISLKGILFVDDIELTESTFENITIINRY